SGRIADGLPRRFRPCHRRSRAIIIVGGNIRGYTRTMTTAIVLETSKGELGFALALGIILVVLSMVVSGLSLYLRASADWPLRSWEIELKLLVRLSLLGFLAVLIGAMPWFTPARAQDRSILVASTTSTQDSGLYGYLLPIVKQRIGIEVKV